MEALNALVAIRKWAHKLRGCLVHLQSDNATAMTIFKAGRGRDHFFQARVCEIWLECAQHEVTLGFLTLLMQLWRAQITR